MNPSKPLIILSVVMTIACSQQQEQPHPGTIAPKVVEAKGYVVPKDRMAEPMVVHAGKPKVVRAGTGKVVPTNTNIHLIGKLTTVMAGTPREIIPGQDGFSLPETAAAIDSSFPVGIPEVVLAKDAYSKEINPQNFLSFSKLQGLKHGNITCILQDNKGNLWLGTGGGITKYDGRSFTHYTEKEGLISNEVLSMVEDRAGNLWIGTNAGLSRLSQDGKRFTMFPSERSLSYDNITSIAQDTSGNLWFGSWSGGVTRLDKDWKSFTQFTTKEGLPSNNVQTLFVDPIGNLWIGTSNGISIYNGHFFSNYSTKEGLGNNTVTCISVDAGGNMWFGTKGGGASRLSQDGRRFTYYSEKEGMSSDQLESICPDNEGNLWFGTNGGGVCRLNSDGKSVSCFTEKEGLSNDVVKCMLEDKNGFMWFGTSGGGVSKYAGRLFTQYAVEEGLNNPIVWSVLEDKKGNLWIGTESGLSQLNPDRNYFNHYTAKEGFSDKPVYCILEDENGNLWYGTSGDGVIQLSQDGKRFTHFTDKEGLTNNNVRCIVEDTSGNFWISTFGGGVSKLSNDGKSFTLFTVKEGLSDNNVRPLLEDRSGNIWLGNDQRGITCLGRDGKSFTNYTVQEGLSHNSVHNMFEDRNGDIWIGTYGGGISRLSNDGKHFMHYTQKEGLSNDNVLSSMQAKNGDLWFGTRFGLNKIPSASLEGENEVVFKTYNYDDGFTGIGVFEGALYEDSKGTIWIGANNGLMAYHPEGDIADTAGPDIQVTTIELFNETIPWRDLEKKKDTGIVLGNGVRVGDFRFDSLSDWYFLPENLSLAHNNNFLTFNYIGITQKQPKKVTYQYKLDGFDENWSALTSRTEAPYGNLPPGTYSFRVKAMNSDGYWSDEFTYPFTIRPPWYKTTWFRFLTSLVILFSLFMIHHMRTASLRRRQKQLEKTVEERTSEVVKQKEEIECQNEELETTMEHLKQTQSQLIQSEKMASLGMLTAGIAHEINNPVNFINSGAISLQKDYEDLQQIISAMEQHSPSTQKVAANLGIDELKRIIPQTIEDIKTGVSRTSEIVRGLRNFTRLDATELKEADLHEGIDSTLLLLSHKITDRIRVVKEYDQQIGFIRCYPGPLNQVFMNLLNNAIDAIDQKIKEDSSAGGALDTKSPGDRFQIGITTKLIEEGIKKQVKIVISDNGIGIPDEIRDKLFDPFFTTKEIGKGTGLGLSICHGIIEKHRGSITFDSDLNNGTTFTITLPIESTG